ncbi:MAG TPA: hypothetical protein VFM51_12160 [Solirubrobacterales bacterium]|nr:hypothetical protein [Solirubrobacterales bacterium]
MFSRIQNKLGTTGLVVAIVALVAALAGAAYAAGGLTKKQEKRVIAIAKKFAGKDGAAGPAGATGPQGPAGAEGKQGPEGKQGLQGTPGEDGTDGVDGEDGACTEGNPECVMPSGGIETGTWAVSPGPVGFQYVALSFTIPLAQAPTDIGFVRENGKERYFDPETFEFKERDPLFCGGTASTPDPDAGKVCVYVEKESKAAGEPTVNFESEVVNQVRLRTSGALFTVAREATNANAIGTWAVSVP